MAVGDADAPEAAKTAFFDQLITWRELSINFVRFQANYDNFECAEPWAHRTLAEHARDRRPVRYTAKQMENAETYDLMKRLTRILAAGRPLQASLEPQSGQDVPAPATAAAPRADLRERSASPVRSVAAAAGAFAERAQSRIDGLAA